MGSFKSHSFKKNILQVVAVIVNTLLQADSEIFALLCQAYHAV